MKLKDFINTLANSYMRSIMEGTLLIKVEDLGDHHTRLTQTMTQLLVMQKFATDTLERISVGAPADFDAIAVKLKAIIDTNEQLQVLNKATMDGMTKHNEVA